MESDTIRDFVNKKTIIVGEVNTGKTVYLRSILRKFRKKGETNIAVIDMAPESTQGIGGKMGMKGFESIRYYTARIVPPRLTGKTSDEVEGLAKKNAHVIEEIFKEYLKTPSSVLFINDISLFLQAGNLSALLSLLNKIPTVIMNGYYGSSLEGGSLGERERQAMEALQKACNRVIRL